MSSEKDPRIVSFKATKDLTDRELYQAARQIARFGLEPLFEIQRYDQKPKEQLLH